MALAPAREVPPWPEWSPPAPPARPGPVAHRLTQAYPAERSARELYEGYGDGAQYADCGRPSLARPYEERQIERALAERRLLWRAQLVSPKR